MHHPGPLEAADDRDRTAPPAYGLAAFAANFHNHTILFRCGNWIFVTYGLFAGAAFWLGFARALWYDAMSGQDVVAKARFYLFGLMPAVLIGARACSVLLERREVLRRPWATLFKPGYMLHGGIFGGLAAFVAYRLVGGDGLPSMLDSAAFALPLGEAVCRIGCYVYGCCWGKPTDSRFGIVYDGEHAKIVRCAPHLRGVRIHPAQLYGSAACFAMYVLFYLLLPYKAFDGMYLALYCLLHPPLRVVLERFRSDDRGTLYGRYSHTQLYSALLFVLGAAVLVYGANSGVNTPLDLEVRLTSVLFDPAVGVPLAAISLVVAAAFGLHYGTVGNWLAPAVNGSRESRAAVSGDERLLATDVLIVGAGPYGISLSYDLHCAGVDFLVVGEPFSLWRRHVSSVMSLRSDVNASQVFARDGRFSLREFLKSSYPADETARLARERIPVGVFRRYVDWILARLPYRPLEQKVIRLEERDEGGFLAELADGRRIAARRVVLASGIESHRTLPEVLRPMSPERVLHSWRVGEVESVRNQKLLIVGGGQSAAELIAHLAEANEITWVHRSKLIFFAEPINLPRPVFALVLRASLIYYFLPDRLRKLLGGLFVAATITPELKGRILRDDIVRLQADVAELGLVERDDGVYSARLDRTFDRVIACTGYKFSLESLGFLSPELLRKIRLNRLGTPDLGFRFESSVPHLFMIGGIAEPVHGPALRFMIGCRQATLRVSAALRRQ